MPWNVSGDADQSVVSISGKAVEIVVQVMGVGGPGGPESSLWSQEAAHPLANSAAVLG